MSDVVTEIAAGRQVVTLDHMRQRTDGVVGVLERGGAIVALCAHRCEISTLPDLSALGSLERLDVGGNRLASLPALPASLRELYVDDNQLVALSALPALHVLDANRNRLASLPPLTDVVFAYAASNRLVQLPAIRDVRYLNVSDNPLSSIESLDGVLELRMETAELAAVPEAVRRLTGLRELHLRGNAIASLPTWIGELRALEVLDVRGNRIDEVPDSLSALPLRKLDLRWNPLRRSQPQLAVIATRGCLVYV
jgi:Leucine-rich repeat (LRR) protein